MSTANVADTLTAGVLTRTECQHIVTNLLKNPNLKLKDFTLDPELKSIGYLGQYYQLVFHCTLNCDSVVQQKYRLFVKSLPYDNAELCDYIVKHGIIKKEATLYATLLKELSAFSKHVWCVQCLYARDDLFVLQNLYEIGYEPSLSEPGNLQDNEVRSLLRGLATMHASSIAYEIKNRLNIGDVYAEVLHEITVSPTEAYFTTGLRSICAVIRKQPQYQDTKSQTYIENELVCALNNVYEMVNPSHRYRNVFCHRDPWGGNVFFRQSEPGNDELNVMLVDFQTCRYCPPAIDVIFALYMNLSSSKRKKEETKYLNWYYKYFEEALETLQLNSNEYLSCAEFIESYREFELFGVLYKAIAATILHVPEGYLSNLKIHNPQKYYRYVYVERTEEVFRLMHESIEFREYMHQCVTELMNVLIEPTIK